MGFAVVDPERCLDLNGTNGIVAFGELLARDDVAPTDLFEVQHRARRHGAVEGNAGRP